MVKFFFNLLNIKNEEIIKYNFDLAYGKIIDGDFLTARYKFIDSYYSDLTISERNNIKDNLTLIPNKIISSAIAGDEIILWLSNNPESMCNFYSLVTLLKNIPCTIYIFKEDSENHFDYRIIEPDNVAYLLEDRDKYKTIINANTKNDISLKWEKLIKENAELRCFKEEKEYILENEIVSSTYDYYDKEIIKFYPQTFFEIKNKLECLSYHGTYYFSERFCINKIKEFINRNIYEIYKSNDDFKKTIIREKRYNDIITLESEHILIKLIDLVYSLNTNVNISKWPPFFTKYKIILMY